MPVKRRVPKNRNPKITPEAVELFRRGCLIISTGDHEFWEKDGGRKSEYYEITTRLDWVLLDVHPGDDGPLSIEEHEQDEDFDDEGGSPSTRASRPRARELHALLKKELRR